MRICATPLAAMLFLLAAGCGEPAYTPPQFTPVVPKEGETGTVRGVVRFDGKIQAARLEPMGSSPECSVISGGKIREQALLVKDGRLQNAFVVLRGTPLDRFRFPIPAAEHSISNQHCLYSPRVSGVRTWQKVRLVNRDPTQHNFRTGSWSRTLSGAGQTVDIWFDKAQKIDLRCDLHNWMLGTLHVVDHPFFATTGEEGVFELKDVPTGEYTIDCWHETLGTLTATVKVGSPGQTVPVEFSYKP